MDDAYAMNCCMDHRGGVGFEKNTGDGAGIMTGIPDKLLYEEKKPMGSELLSRAIWWATCFCPMTRLSAPSGKTLIESELEPCNLELIGWRELPVNVHRQILGNRLSAMPKIEQLFIKAVEPWIALLWTDNFILLGSRNTQNSGERDARRPRSMSAPSPLSFSFIRACLRLNRFSNFLMT